MASNLKHFHHLKRDLITENLVIIHFYFLAVPCIVWNLSSPSRDQIHIPWSGSAES